MKVLFGLTVLSVVPTVCNGYCVTHPLKPEVRQGVLMPPTECVDRYEGKKYPIGSVWDTTGCLTCECDDQEITCCLRYPPYASFPGCAVILDEETCTYIVHEIGDPSKPCTPEF